MVSIKTKLVYHFSSTNFQENAIWTLQGEWIQEWIGYCHRDERFRQIERCFLRHPFHILWVEGFPLQRRSCWSPKAGQRASSEHLVPSLYLIKFDAEKVLLSTPKFLVNHRWATKLPPVEPYRQRNGFISDRTEYTWASIRNWNLPWILVSKPFAAEYHRHMHLLPQNIADICRLASCV